MSEHHAGPPDEDYNSRWVHAVGETTIPLLAGFSVTSVIVVSDDAANFRWPGLTVLALGFASVVLIAAVQSSYLARLAFSSEVETSKATSGKAWAGRMRLAYYCGIVALLAGLGLALAPLHGKSMENALRWIASIIAFVGCAAEIVTIFNVTIFQRRQSGSGRNAENS
jgi:hypothetical protein